MERNTKQKELIISIIKDDRSHPTIKEIVDKVKRIDSTIGQATVYRNINNLLKNNIIKKISIPQELDRYEYIIGSHLHLKCSKCNKIIDIFDDNLDSFIKSINDTNDIEMIDYSLSIEGICRNCLNKGGK